MNSNNITIRLSGGDLNGTQIPNVSQHSLPSKLHYDSQKVYVRDLRDLKGVQIERRRQHLPANWHSFTRNVYVRSNKQTEPEDILYDYSGEVTIKRCKGVNDSGKRCIKPAEDGKSYCCCDHS
ncbi:hypothetical protein DZ860_05090 [Vibrio sinensis]|uniref:Uncharacterized protein n=1 Tax=Vibrio sinensis TaxID=2302434 RepID=A0A3A6RAL4_9VIBR|nr:hypothetical protein [Vibrio sinensis]RJX73611.1 hypothetical protein DZ860_05090 [Vibrio sinensis]